MRNWGDFAAILAAWVVGLLILTATLAYCDKAGA